MRRSESETSFVTFNKTLVGFPSVRNLPEVCGFAEEAAAKRICVIYNTVNVNIQDPRLPSPRRVPVLQGAGGGGGEHGGPGEDGGGHPDGGGRARGHGDCDQGLGQGGDQGAGGGSVRAALS